MIHSLENPHSEEGGLRILKGNLAKDGAVIKSGATEVKRFEGPCVILIHKMRRLPVLCLGRLRKEM